MVNYVRGGRENNLTFDDASPSLLVETFDISLLTNFQWSVYKHLVEG